MDEEDVEASEGDSGAGWMATFADMMTLLLCFFVLLLSFATMDVVKFQDALGSVQEALGVDVPNVGNLQVRATSPDQADPFDAVPEVIEDYELLAELEAALQAEGLQKEVAVELTGRGVLMRISGRVMYDPGDATLQERAFSLLNRLAALVGSLEHVIMIEGHTDNIPIATARFPSNWELSTARSIAAMRYLESQGVAAVRIAVAGYADQRPLGPNDTAENRAANRRVEFVFRRQLSAAALERPDETVDTPDVEGTDGDAPDVEIAG